MGVMVEAAALDDPVEPLERGHVTDRDRPLGGLRRDRCKQCCGKQGQALHGSETSRLQRQRNRARPAAALTAFQPRDTHLRPTFRGSRS